MSVDWIVDCKWKHTNMHPIKKLLELSRGMMMGDFNKDATLEIQNAQGSNRF